RTKLDKEKDHIRAMAGELKSGTEYAVYNGHKYTSRQLSDRLSRELEVSQVMAKQLESKERLLESEEKALEAAKERLANMKNVKDQIDAEISRLQADVENLRLAQDRSKVQFDDSRLAHIKNLLNEVGTQVKVELKTLDYAQTYDFESPTVEKKAKTTAQLIKEADDLTGDSDNGKVAGK